MAFPLHSECHQSPGQVERRCAQFAALPRISCETPICFDTIGLPGCARRKALIFLIASDLIGNLLLSSLFHTVSSLMRDVTVGAAGAIASGLSFNSAGLPNASSAVVAGSFGAAAGLVTMLFGYRAVS